MPNYCDSTLRITGEKEEVKRFKEFASTKESLLDMNKFIPYPKEFEEKDELYEKFRELKDKKEKGNLTEKEMRELTLMSLNPEEYKDDGYNSGGYNWCVRNWGTKWNFCNPELSSDYRDDEIFYVFETAWSPAIPVILKMSEMFPKLKFNYKYWEAGSCFRGILICKNNKIIKEATYNYNGDRGG